VSRKCFAATRTSFAAMMMWSILGKVSAVMVRGVMGRSEEAVEAQILIVIVGIELRESRHAFGSHTIPACLVHKGPLFFQGRDALAGQQQEQTGPHRDRDGAAEACGAAPLTGMMAGQRQYRHW